MQKLTVKASEIRDTDRVRRPNGRYAPVLQTVPTRDMHDASKQVVVVAYRTGGDNIFGADEQVVVKR